MGKINWSRVLLGGLLAGVIINVFEFVANGVFLAADWEAMMKALGRSTAPSPTAGVIFLLWGFLCGIGAIWVICGSSSEFRPRLENGRLDRLRILAHHHRATEYR